MMLGLFACIALYESLVAKNFPLWTVLLPAPFAAYLFLQSRRLQNKILRLSGWANTMRPESPGSPEIGSRSTKGKSLSDPDHFYAADLDLFGHGSLFQLICSARTQAGRETLANWMKAPCSWEEALARQERHLRTSRASRLARRARRRRRGQSNRLPPGNIPGLGQRKLTSISALETRRRFRIAVFFSGAAPSCIGFGVSMDQPWCRA